jgi:hypothetical protein
MSRFATNKPTTPAEKAAAVKAHAHIVAEGFTPSAVQTFVTLVPGKGATVFAASFETAPGTCGHPAAHIAVPVTI